MALSGKTSEGGAGKGQVQDEDKGGGSGKHEHTGANGCQKRTPLARVHDQSERPTSTQTTHLPLGRIDLLELNLRKRDSPENVAC